MEIRRKGERVGFCSFRSRGLWTAVSLQPEHSKGIPYRILRSSLMISLASDIAPEKKKRHDGSWRRPHPVYIHIRTLICRNRQELYRHLVSSICAAKHIWIEIHLISLSWRTIDLPQSFQVMDASAGRSTSTQLQRSDCGNIIINRPPSLSRSLPCHISRRRMVKLTVGESAIRVAPWIDMYRHTFLSKGL